MSSTSEASAVNPEKLEAFLGKVVTDFGAALSSQLVYIGQKLGLYKALAGAGPSTPAELAGQTGTQERYVREWLINQAAGGYVEYDAAAKRFHLSPEQAAALADEESPAFVGGGFYLIKAMTNAVPRIEDAFREGGGILWGDHDPDLFVGVERFFRPGYRTHLVNDWIPALTGIEEKLKAGGTVADVGCGHGASTIIMAQAYPDSRFKGFDNHGPSIEAARQRAEEAGVGDRCEFEVSSADAIPEGPYDLVCFFDCLHDMGDPVGAARRAHAALKPGGTVLLVEPFANDSLEENLNPVGRLFYAASTCICTPNSLSQEVGLGLGAQAGEKRLRHVFMEAGF